MLKKINRFLNKTENERIDSPIICKCKKIDRKTIVEAINNGADTYEKVKIITGAGSTRCKGAKCKDKIEEIIKEVITTSR